MTPSKRAPVLTRRAALGTLAVAGASPLLHGTACSADACEAYPDLEEGPYYLAGAAARADITSGTAGAPLALRFVVVDGDCKPVEGATVDIWHADPSGDYSTSAKSFLRGTQDTDGDGVADFVTVYPGWYPGRTTHVHLKVLVDGDERTTTQMFFPEDVTKDVYGSGAYAARGQKDTSNADDSVYQDGDEPAVVEVAADGAGGFTATFTIYVST